MVVFVRKLEVVSMVVFLRKLEVVHKQVWGCLNTYNVQLACGRKFKVVWRFVRALPHRSLWIENKFAMCGLGLDISFMCGKVQLGPKVALFANIGKGRWWWNWYLNKVCWLMSGSFDKGPLFASAMFWHYKSNQDQLTNFLNMFHYWSSIIECPQPETCFEPFLENGSVDGEGGDHLWTGTFNCNPGEKSRCNPGEKPRCNPGEPLTVVFSAEFV